MSAETIKAWVSNHFGSVKWNGAQCLARCPLPTHGGPDKHPSLSINVEKGLFNCFAEDKGGTLAQLAAELGWEAPPVVAMSTQTVAQLVASYEYRLGDGTLAYVVDRFEPKDFRMRRPDGDRFSFNLKGVAPLPYRLPELLTAQQSGRTIFVVEGEKDAARLQATDLVATTNHGGAGNWTSAHSQYFKEGAEVVVLSDNDPPGRKHGLSVAAQLLERGCRVKIVDLPGLPEKGDVSDWLDVGNTIDDLATLISSLSYITIEDLQTRQLSAEFDGIELLAIDRTELPGFPLDALPPVFQEFVRHEAEATQTPPDLAGMLCLAVGAASVARHVRIKLAEGYSEPLNLYVGVVMAPANRKSAIVEDVTRPITDRERELQEEAKSEIARAKTRYEAAQLRIEGLKTKLRKTDLAPERRSEVEAELETLSVDLEQADIPPYPKLITDNCTTERVASLLGEQEGRIAIFSAEGTMFEIVLGRYAKGRSDFDIFLKGHAGDTVRYDRQGRSPIMVDKAAITIGIAFQPSVLLSLGECKELRGKGLIARFAFVIPRDLIGERDVDPAPVPANIRLQYHQTIRALLEIAPEIDPETKEKKPRWLKLSSQANRLRLEYARTHEKKLPLGGELHSIQDWAGKLPGLISRVAGILHLAAHTQTLTPWDIEVAAETYGNAIKIGEYLTRHALAAYRMLQADPVRNLSVDIIEWAQKKGLRKVSRREIFNVFRHRSVIGGTMTGLDPVLKFMELHGCIKVVKASDKPHAKESLWILFNPRLFDSGLENPENPLTGADAQCPQCPQTDQEDEGSDSTMIELGASQLLRGEL